MLDNEIKLMCMCSHPNILSIHDHRRKQVEQRNQYNQSYIAQIDVTIVLEYCEGCSLDKYLQMTNKPSYAAFDPDFFNHIAVGIIRGLRYLHIVQSIIHRDLKPQNVLLKKHSRSNYYIVKICDFGFAQKLDRTGSLNGYCGTEVFMAPEVLMKQTYNYKVDIFSLGATLYNMITGGFPLITEQNARLMQCNQRYPPIQFTSIWDNYPDLKNFVQGLLKFDPKERLNWPKIHDDPYAYNILKYYE